MDLQNLARLQTEAVNPRTGMIDRVSTQEMCELINKEDQGVADSITPCLDQIAEAIDALVPRVRAGGRVVYVGAGTSGRLGILDASEIPPTFAASPDQFVGLIAGGDAAIRRAQEGAEDSELQGRADMEALDLKSDSDSVIGIAASGRTPYVLGCLEFAKGIGCVTVGVVCAHPSAMGRSGHVDFLISPLPGPEVVTGSTRLKAGTATKLVLNMISTGVMIRLGKTYGNMMVDMVASNAKLRQRARNMLRRLSNACASMSDEEVDSLLQRCDQRVKLALLVAETDRPVEECRVKLHSSGGRLAEALGGTLASIARTKEIDVESGGRQFVLCIDGGGTKCKALLADGSGAVVGRGLAGPCNLTDAACLDDALRIIDAAVNGAVHSTQQFVPGIALHADKDRLWTKFKAIWVGLAGMDRPGLQEALRARLAADYNLHAPDTTLRLTNDVDLLAAAMTKHPEIDSAIVVIAGTGSVAMRYKMTTPGELPERVARAGGWGHLLGDEGGGYALGLQAIKHTLTRTEGIGLGLSDEALGPLEEAVLRQLGVSGSQSVDLLSVVLVGEQRTDVKPRIARVAQVVLELAEMDATAMGMVVGQVDKLVDKTLGPLVNSGCTSAVPAQKTGLILSGGLLTQPLYQRLFRCRVLDCGMEFAHIEVVGDAGAAGAQWLASVSLGAATT